MVCAIVGFGAVALAGVYAASARRIERPGELEETVRYFRARGTGEWVLIAVPVLGVAAVAVDPSGGGLGRPWVVVALTLWVLAAVLVARVARPARVALRAAVLVEPAPVDLSVVRLAATRLARAAALCDIVFVAAVIDMVIRPG